MSLRVQGIPYLVQLCLFTPLFILGIALFLKKRDAFPIIGKFPRLTVIIVSVMFSWFLALCFSQMFYGDYPCVWFYAWRFTHQTLMVNMIVVKMWSLFVKICVSETKLKQFRNVSKQNGARNETIITVVNANANNHNHNNHNHNNNHNNNNNHNHNNNNQQQQQPQRIGSNPCSISFSLSSIFHSKLHLTRIHLTRPFQSSINQNQTKSNPNQNQIKSNQSQSNEINQNQNKSNEMN